MGTRSVVLGPAVALVALAVNRGRATALPCQDTNGALWPGCIGAVEGEESGP
jgi:hypothetical protein